MGNKNRQNLMTRGPGSSCFKGELHVMLSAWINCFGKNVGKTDYSIHWAVIYLVDSITPPWTTGAWYPCINHNWMTTITGLTSWYKKICSWVCFGQEAQERNIFIKKVKSVQERGHIKWHSLLVRIYPNTLFNYKYGMHTANLKKTWTCW